MHMKTILVVVPSFESGGTVSSLMNFVSLLDKTRYHLSVFAITNAGPNKKFIAEHSKIVGDSTKVDTKISMVNHVRSRVFGAVKSIKKLLEKFGVDISPLLFRYYASRIDKKNYDYVLAFQEGQATLFCSYFKHGFKIAWVRSEYTRFIRTAKKNYSQVYEKYDRIVSVSMAAMNSFLTVLPQYKDIAVVQYNFLNKDRILQLSKETPDDLWPKDAFTIVTLGRIDPVKRVSYIPQLCREIIDRGFIVRWVIIGGIAIKEEYLRLLKNIEKYNVEDNIVIMGNKPNPYPYLKHSELLVSLSVSETFNNTLTEAKILGIPIVTTDYLCAFESVENNRDGLVVSFDSIVSSIIDMISDKERLYTSIKDRLHAYHYDEKALLDQLYTNVLS